MFDINLHSRKLPDTCRLKSPGQFSSVFKAANRKGGRFFTLFILRRDDNLVPRLGVAVAKRFFKRAHERNRLKRLVRENFRIHKETLVGLDVVIVMKKEASLCTNREFSDSLRHAWSKLPITLKRSV